MAYQNHNAVAITGGSVTGMPLPATANDVATKQYVDSVAAGLVIHTPVRLATANALPANTYDNGAGTLTANGNGALSVDGAVTSPGDRILVKDEASAPTNGLYVVTSAGDAGNLYRLTRSSDANTAGVNDPLKMGIGSYVFVPTGTVNGNSGWIISAPVTVLGTSAVEWTQFFAWASQGTVQSVTIAAGTNLSESGTCVITTVGTCTLALSPTIAGAMTFNGAVTNNALTTLAGGLIFGGNTIATPTGTGAMVLTNSPTITSAAINYATISYGAVNYATMYADSMTSPTITYGTINSSTLNSATLQGTTQIVDGSGAGFYINPLLVSAGTQYLCRANDGLVGRNSGVCGASAKRFKDPRGEIPGGSAMAALDTLPFNIPVWQFKKDQGDEEVHVGFYADDVEKMDMRCAIYEDGKLQNYDDRCVISYLVAAVKEQHKEIEHLRHEINRKGPRR